MHAHLRFSWSPDARPRPGADHHPPLPAPATPLSAGLDLCAWVEAPVTLLPTQRVRVPTGLCVEIPPGFEGQVRPRSGLAARHGVTVLNAPGTIDADYRGELQVLLVNLGAEPFTIRHLDRVAQLVVAPVAHPVTTALVDALGDTARGAGGFGSTGGTGGGGPPASGV
jgi:dUTP pyrophosphatase